MLSQALIAFHALPPSIPIICRPRQVLYSMPSVSQLYVLYVFSKNNI